MQQRRSRQCTSVGEKGCAHFAISLGILLDVGQVGYEPHDVIHVAADGSERGLDVLERLHCLGAEFLCGLSAGIDAGLAGYKDQTMRTVDFDYLAVSRRLGHPGRIGMAHIRSRLSLR